MTTITSAQQQFYADFQVVEQELSQAFESPSLNDCQKLLNQLQMQLNESLAVLPARDVEQYQSKIKLLSLELRNKRNEIVPKKRFQFKSRHGATRVETVNVKDEITSDKLVDNSTVNKKNLDRIIELAGSIKIDCISSVEINEARYPQLKLAQSLTLASLSNCTVSLIRTSDTPYKSITFKNAKNCKINASKSSGSLFLDECENCQIEGQAQQIRIHDCKSCTIRYKCFARNPIIENCSDMKFLNIANTNDMMENTVVDDFSDLSGERANWSVDL